MKKKSVLIFIMISVFAIEAFSNSPHDLIIGKWKTIKYSSPSFERAMIEYENEIKILNDKIASVGINKNKNLEYEQEKEIIENKIFFAKDYIEDIKNMIIVFTNESYVVSSPKSPVLDTGTWNLSSDEKMLMVHSANGREDTMIIGEINSERLLLYFGGDTSTILYKREPESSSLYLRVFVDSSHLELRYSEKDSMALFYELNAKAPFTGYMYDVFPGTDSFTLQSVQIHNGRRNGEYIRYTTIMDTAVSGNYFEGLKSWYWIIFNEDRSYSTGYFNKNKKSGTWYFYDSQRRKIKEIIYGDNEMILSTQEYKVSKEK